jgi:hypothetical protein
MNRVYTLEEVCNLPFFIDVYQESSDGKYNYKTKVGIYGTDFGGYGELFRLWKEEPTKQDLKNNPW